MATKEDLRIVDFLTGHFRVDLGGKVLSVFNKPNIIRFVNGGELALISKSNSIILVGRTAVARYAMQPDGSYRIFPYAGGNEEGISMDPIDYVLRQIEGDSQSL
jgi:hypothetical protein